MTPAAAPTLVDVLRRLYDPYGMAFGPRQPWYGYRPNPYGTPAQPWPNAFNPPFHGAGRSGWGISGWNWGQGAGTYKHGIPQRFGFHPWDPRTTEDRSWRENLAARAGPPPRVRT